MHLVICGLEDSVSRLLLSLVILGLFVSCTRGPETNLNWTSQGVLPPAPDSVKVKTNIKFQTTQGNMKEKGSVDAFIYAIPNKKYRIELKGPLGVQVASILWLETNWQVYIPSEKIVFQGQGQAIQLPIPGFKDLSIHQLVSSLWGEVFPIGWQKASHTQSGETTFLKWSCDSKDCISTIDKQSGRVNSLQIDSTLWKYQNWTKQQNFKYPTHIEVIDLNQQLQIDVEEIDLQPSWNSRLWKLRFPPSTKIRDIAQ